jgi:hypothetical protein
LPRRTPRGRDAKYRQPQIVRRPCSKSWPPGNYVCTFAREVLDMGAPKGNPVPSRWWSGRKIKNNGIRFVAFAWGV